MNEGFIGFRENNDYDYRSHDSALSEKKVGGKTENQVKNNKNRRRVGGCWRRGGGSLKVAEKGPADMGPHI